MYYYMFNVSTANFLLLCALVQNKAEHNVHYVQFSQFKLKKCTLYIYKMHSAHNVHYVQYSQLKIKKNPHSTYTVCTLLTMYTTHWAHFKLYSLHIILNAHYQTWKNP